jgi:hypothetical protein
MNQPPISINLVGGPNAYEAQLIRRRDELAEQLRATEDELGKARKRAGNLQRQLTRTEQTLAAEEQNSIRELAAAVQAEQQAARLRAAWQSACRRSTHHLHGKWAAQTNARTAEAKLTAVRALHPTEICNEWGGLECGTCREVWPCPTISALDGPEAQS